jgi:glycerol-3-phosphate dehydrogenase subunit C
MPNVREGSLEAPKREPVDWQGPDFYDEGSLYAELERVYDICHGCRRCVNLCEAFPTLFDLVDESETMEVDGVAKSDYAKVVEQCYLCDLCAETKCPYLPPHEWAVDFPHLMLRAKAYRFKQGEVKLRDRLITSTDRIIARASIPGVNALANAANRSAPMRALMERFGGIHPEAPLPEFHARTAKKRLGSGSGEALPVQPTQSTRGKLALFVTCYGERNEPELVEDMAAVFNHNAIPVSLVQGERCCGMPKLELGDLETVAKLMEANIPKLVQMVDSGFDLTAPIPSCVLMFKQELPLLFPNDPDVAKVGEAFFDPFEYLVLRHREGLLRTDFTTGLGKVSYHMACHQRVQNIGQRTREVLQLIPDTEVLAIDRCSGHDGTYALKSETYDHAMKIARPVVRRVNDAGADHYGSDCPMAGRMIEHGLADGSHAEHPLTLLRKAYGL